MTAELRVATVDRQGAQRLAKRKLTLRAARRAAGPPGGTDCAN